MEAIQKEQDRLLKKSNLSKPIAQVSKIVTLLTNARNRIASDPSSYKTVLKELKDHIGPAVSLLNDEQKEVYNALNKYGKALDKKFKTAASFSSTDYDALASEGSLINRAIAMHLIREGNFNVAKTFIEEAAEKGEKLDVSPELTKEFESLYDILDAMKLRHDLGPAINWARSKAVQLEARGSNLEFELCKLQYIWLFTGEGAGPMGDKRALDYARQAFSRFQTKYLSDIQKLIAAFAYVNRIKRSPYAELFDNPQQLWVSVSRTFTREFCSLLQLSAESPLYIAATAGAIALPTLLKMTSIMKEKKTEWSSENELPVEIPLPPRYQFHSIFVCPVSKEQTTESNPPHMLPCGHVIAYESMLKITKGQPSANFKCPYCPKECNAGMTKRVYL